MHAGIYYKAGSLKATLCTTGVRLLFAYCDEKGIPVDRCGKVIVATDAERIAPAGRPLSARASPTGCRGWSGSGRSALRELEPHAAGIAAIYSPNTAIVDFRRVADAYAADVRARGGVVVTECEVRGLRETPEGIRAGDQPGRAADGER